MTQANLIADTRATFTALPADAKDITATVGDRIIMVSADGTEDVFTVLTVKKKELIGQSLLDSAAKLRLMLTYDAGVNDLTDGTKLELLQMPESMKTEQTAAPAIRKGRAPKRGPGGVTKIAACKAIWLETANAEHVKNVTTDPGTDEAAIKARSESKSALCKLFQHTAGCTRMGANTYFLTLQKAAVAGSLDEVAKGRQDEEAAPEAGGVAANTAATETEQEAEAAV